MLQASPYSEKELLSRISRGNEQAFTEIFNLYRNKIFTVAYKLTGSEVNAEEIVQDVFLKVWIKREILGEIGNFDSWLFIVTRNKVISYLRTRAARELHKELKETDFIGISEEADVRLKEKEFQKLLKEAIDRLPHQQKLVYRLSNDAGLNYEQIAERIGIASETARKHMQYAMRSIRTHLMSHMDLGILVFIFWGIS